MKSTRWRWIFLTFPQLSVPRRLISRNLALPSADHFNRERGEADPQVRPLQGKFGLDHDPPDVVVGRSPLQVQSKESLITSMCHPTTTNTGTVEVSAGIMILNQDFFEISPGFGRDCRLLMWDVPGNLLPFNVMHM